MRHLKAGNRLGVTTAHRRAIMRNMVTSILENGQITCTLARAKEVRKPLEKMIGWGKQGNLHARRQALRFVKSKEAMTQLFGDLADRYKDRQGGYCRIIKLGKTRLGDNSEMAIIQLLGSNADQLSELKSQTGKKKKPKKKESSVLKEVSEGIKTESSSETKIKPKKEKTQDENEAVKGVPSADTTPVEKETEQKREEEVATNTVQENIESDTKTEEQDSVEDSTRDKSEAKLDKGEVKDEPVQKQEEAEATSGQDDTVETNSEKNSNN